MLSMRLHGCGNGSAYLFEPTMIPESKSERLVERPVDLCSMTNAGLDTDRHRTVGVIRLGSTIPLDSKNRFWSVQAARAYSRNPHGRHQRASSLHRADEGQWQQGGIDADITGGRSQERKQPPFGHF
jgi:hypothetical protein